MPHLHVALVESSRVPIIGVGEGTTPTMVPFLHGYLGLDVAEVVADVQPTWKLGVRLDWGIERGEPFQFSFAAPHHVDSYVRTGSINQAGFVTELMNRSAGLHALEPDLTIRSLVSSVPFAYHLDNQRFVGYLAHAAETRGVQLIDAHLVDHSLRSDGSLAAVTADDGRRFEFDLFVDCTGFRSALLGEAMHVDFKSYRSSLFTDAAVVGRCRPQRRSQPLHGIRHHDCRVVLERAAAGGRPRGLRPFHRPHLDRRRRGRAAPSLPEPWRDPPRPVHIRSPSQLVGAQRRRHRELLRLRRTPASHGAPHGRPRDRDLVQRIREGRPLDGTHDDVNRHIASIWDDICALLALHYRYNHRLDSPFWRDARSHTDLGVLGPVIDEAIDGGSMTRLVELGQVDLHHGVRGTSTWCCSACNSSPQTGSAPD